MEIKRLKDLIVKKPQYGYSCNSFDSQKPNSILLLTQSCLINNKKKIYTTKIVGYEKFLIKKNDFLFSRAGTIESWYSSYDKEIIFDNNLIRYFFDQKILLNKYLFLWTKKINIILIQYQNQVL